MDCNISGSCYKGTFLQRIYRKMTILWSFSFNSFVKLIGKTIWEPQHSRVVMMRCGIKELHCIWIRGKNLKGFEDIKHFMNWMG